VTKKEFLVRQKETAIGDCVSQGELLRGKTLSKSQIDELVRTKILLPQKYHSRIYYNLQEVKNGIRLLIDRKKQKQSRLFGE
ncbi:MAG: hypothetical protein NTY66_00600, partial [Candidatus Vogelbacteria bacterium]|nr:hypothetical protein [Candidatus Vogelbacteria bacterium]